LPQRHCFSGGGGGDTTVFFVLLFGHNSTNSRQYPEFDLPLAVQRFSPSFVRPPNMILPGAGSWVFVPPHSLFRLGRACKGRGPSFYSLLAYARSRENYFSGRTAYRRPLPPTADCKPQCAGPAGAATARLVPPHAPALRKFSAAPSEKPLRFPRALFFFLAAATSRRTFSKALPSAKPLSSASDPSSYAARKNRDRTSWWR